jgi:hypothetical protein
MLGVNVVALSLTSSTQALFPLRDFWFSRKTNSPVASSLIMWSNKCFWQVQTSLDFQGKFECCSGKPWPIFKFPLRGVWYLQGLPRTNGSLTLSCTVTLLKRPTDHKNAITQKMNATNQSAVALWLWMVCFTNCTLNCYDSKVCLQGPHGSSGGLCCSKVTLYSPELAFRGSGLASKD